MSKLRGARLEAEVTTARGESNWRRLEDLLPQIRAKNSGMENLVIFFQNECMLEKFIEEKSLTSDGLLLPSSDFANQVSTARNEFEQILFDRQQYKDDTILEVHLLLAKLHYVCASYTNALSSVNNSQLEQPSIQFNTLRILKLVAEAYAIKGLSLERQAVSEVPNQRKNTERQILYCFEKSAELTISYIAELEKSLRSTEGNPNLAISANLTISSISSMPKLSQSDRLGEFIETALQRVPLLQIKSGTETRQAAIRALDKGVERYRSILTAIGDKNVAQSIHQKLLRQLAEVLLRGTPPACYPPIVTSKAYEKKLRELKFYTKEFQPATPGANPRTLFEEVLLCLSISESLASRYAILSRSPDALQARTFSVATVNAVHNLLILVLANMRQYHLAAGLLEKALKFAYNDQYIWRQFALSLIAANRFNRAALVLRQCISNEDASDATDDVGEEAFDAHDSKMALDTSSVTDSANETTPITDADDLDRATMLLLSAKIALQHECNYRKTIDMCQKAKSFLNKGLSSERELLPTKARANLIEALAYSSLANTSPTRKERQEAHHQALDLMHQAAQLDMRDHLSRYYLALQYAHGGNLERAEQELSYSMALDPEQPFAYILLALIFSCQQNNQEALKVIETGLDEYPNHYALQVVRLLFEAHFGLTNEALATGSDLLMFWCKQELVTHRKHMSGCYNDGSSEVSTTATGSQSPSFFTDPFDEDCVHMSLAWPTKTNPESRLNALVTSPPPSTSFNNRSTSNLALASSMAGPPHQSYPMQSTGNMPHPPNSLQMSNSYSNIDVSQYDGNDSLCGGTGAVSSVFGAMTTQSTVSDKAADSLHRQAALSGALAGGFDETDGNAYMQYTLHANMWVQLADLLITLGNGEKDVFTCIETALVRFPNTHHSLYLRARMLLAKVLDSSEEALCRQTLEQAKSCLLGALCVEPHHLPSMRALTNVYQYQGNLRMAEKLLRDCIYIDACSAESWTRLGEVLSAREQYDEAVDCFATAAELHQKSPIIPFNVLPRAIV